MPALTSPPNEPEARTEVGCVLLLLLLLLLLDCCCLLLSLAQH
jgi:hypothetical protein